MCRCTSQHPASSYVARHRRAHRGSAEFRNPDRCCDTRRAPSLPHDSLLSSARPPRCRRSSRLLPSRRRPISTGLSSSHSLAAVNDGDAIAMLAIVRMVWVFGDPLLDIGDTDRRRAIRYVVAVYNTDVRGSGPRETDGLPADLLAIAAVKRIAEKAF